MASSDAPGAYDRFYQPAYGRHPPFGSEGDGSLVYVGDINMHEVPPETSITPTAHFTASESLGHEEALVHASDLLRCAMATAYECGDSLSGAQRDLAFSVVHLIEMARTMVERSLR
nr:hypothetical protein [Pseudomonas cichorii]